MAKYILWFILVLFPISAPAQEDVQLQVRLRYSDGTAVVGETVVLEGDTLRQAQGDPFRQAQDDPIRQAQDDTIRQAQGSACTTDTTGLCSWSVTPGLYQVLFTRQLDDLSALALAEGGLDGFGLTVGLSDIVYHFTFHSDGRVYFDAAPDAAVPSPIIPEPEDLHLPVLPTEPYPAETATPPPSSVSVTNTQAAAPDSTRRLFLFIIGGLILGVTLHFLRLGSGQVFRPFLVRRWTRIRADLAQKRPNTPEEEQEA